MASDSAEDREHQDQSIKARKVQLFEVGKPEEVVETRHPFRYYVAQTPAAPLSPNVKASLWAVGVLVVLLFLAALLIGPHKPKRHHADLAPPRPVARAFHA